MDAAIQHCGRGTSVWQWASNDEGCEPDVVPAAAGDIPTMEALAAAQWLRELKLRVVNVVDLMALVPPKHHPHRINETAFVRMCTADKPVTFALHGYQPAVHEIIHGRVKAERFHVRSVTEQGTTTTPIDVVMLNGMSRYHLASAARRRASRLSPQAQELIVELDALIQKADAYSQEHLQDVPQIRDWTWA
jgi:xylulose-5-phosphate/fructose-6-phosphate phosphoketolase